MAISRNFFLASKATQFYTHLPARHGVQAFSRHFVAWSLTMPEFSNRSNEATGRLEQ